MGKKKNRIPKVNKNQDFVDNLILNDLTYIHYLQCFKRLSLSMFEWVNLPKSMNSQWLEKCLYYHGMASLLNDENYGFINTNCTSNGYINIYGLPSSLNCYSYDYQSSRKLYTGLENEENSKNLCILVQNNWDREPIHPSMELFSYRLYNAERTCDTNITAQKTPILLLVPENQRLMLENLYSQFEGNKPAIFGDADQLSSETIKSINTQAPFVADKIMDYKKQIWNEALTFLRY